jgi:hypothetical protein
MSHGLGHDGAAGHKAESVNEIGKPVLAMELGIYDRPSTQIVQRGTNFGLGEFLDHRPNGTSRQTGCL